MLPGMTSTTTANRERLAKAHQRRNAPKAKAPAVRAWAIYARRSQDDGDTLGCASQVTNSLRLLDGATPIATYTDDGYSAFTGEPRPDYRRLCADIRSGKVTGVVAQDRDRLNRLVIERGDWMQLCADHGVEVVTVNGGPCDYDSADGRMMEIMLCAMAERESRHKGERVGQRRDAEARAGRMHGGRQRWGIAQFGRRKLGQEWTEEEKAERLAKIPGERAALNEAVDRLLAGQSLKSIEREFQARDIRSPGGKVVTAITLRRTLLSPYIAGIRSNYGEEIADLKLADGTPLEPIVDPVKWRKVKALLEDPDRRTNQHGGTRRHLLSGLLSCSLCPGKLISKSNNRRDAYQCNQCQRVSIRSDYLEEAVSQAVRERIASSTLPTTDDREFADVTAQVAEVKRSQEQLDADFYEPGQKTLTKARYLKLVTALQARLDELEQTARSLVTVNTMDGVPTKPRQLQRWWDDATVEERRNVIAAWVDTIVILPAAHRGERFTMRRVDPRWRDAD